MEARPPEMEGSCGWIISRRRPTRGGPTAWWLGEVLKTNHRKTLRLETYQKVSDVWQALVNAVMNRHGVVGSLEVTVRSLTTKFPDIFLFLTYNGICLILLWLDTVSRAITLLVKAMLESTVRNSVSAASGCYWNVLTSWNVLRFSSGQSFGRGSVAGH